MNIYRMLVKWLVVMALSLSVSIFTACNKLLDPGLPDNSVVSSQVYSNDSLAEAAVKGMYGNIMQSFGLLNGFMSRYNGFSADELDRTSLLDVDASFLSNMLNEENSVVKQVWTAAYNQVYIANDILEGLNRSSSVTPGMRSQLMGEALFLRSLTYFYLLNLYGDVPLVLITDYTQSAVIPRTAVSTIYGQLITDLKQAQNLLSASYVTTSLYPTERVRANKWAASALLARVYLYRQQWAEAEAEATAVINAGIYKLEENLQQTFLYNSREAILQFMPVSAAFNTAEGAMFVPFSPVSRPSITVTDSLKNSFEPTDARLAWIRTVVVDSKPYHSPYKYKLNQGNPRIEYNMVLRLAEQYLVRAEARAMQNKLSDAIADLNSIRTRAALPNHPASLTQTEVLTALEQERRIELFAEWGHRWFDLKRWPPRPVTSDKQSRLDEVMSALRPTTWKITAVLWPIPGIELNRNPFLTQNPGY